MWNYYVTPLWRYYVAPNFYYNPWFYGAVISLGAGLMSVLVWRAYKPRVLPVLVVLIFGWLLGLVAFSYAPYLAANYRYPLCAAAFVALGAALHPKISLFKGNLGLAIASVFVFFLFVWPFLQIFWWDVQHNPQASDSLQNVIWILILAVGGLWIFRGKKKGGDDKGGHGHH